MIVLQSFQHPGRFYQLDLESSSYGVVTPAGRPNQAVAGLAEVLRIGLLPGFRERVFLAIFTVREALFLQIGQRRFQLKFGQVRVSRRSWIPFVRLASIFIDNERVARLVYFAGIFDLLDDIGDGDLLAFLSSTLSSRESFDQFLRHRLSLETGSGHSAGRSE